MMIGWRNRMHSWDKAYGCCIRIFLGPYFIVKIVVNIRSILLWEITFCMELWLKLLKTVGKTVIKNLWNIQGRWDSWSQFPWDVSSNTKKRLKSNKLLKKLIFLRLDNLLFPISWGLSNLTNSKCCGELNVSKNTKTFSVRFYQVLF